MPGVVFTERVGAAVGFVDGLTVAQPLVLGFVSGNAVAVFYDSGEFAAQFGFARDADVARVVGGIGGIRPGVVGNGVTFGGRQQRNAWVVAIATVVRSGGNAVFAFAPAADVVVAEVVAALLRGVVFDGIGHVAAFDVVARDEVFARVFEGDACVFFFFVEGGVLFADVADVIRDDDIAATANGNTVVPGAVGVVLDDEVVVRADGQAVVVGRHGGVFGNDGVIRAFGEADAFKGGCRAGHFDMVIDGGDTGRRPKLGGVTANAHAAFDVMDAVADDGGIRARVLDHDAEAVGTVRQSCAVDIVINDAQMAAAAARFLVALGEDGAAAAVFDGELADLDVFTVGYLDGVCGGVAVFPLHVQHEVAQVDVVGVAAGWDKDGRVVVVFVVGEDGGTALTADDFVLCPCEVDLPNAVVSGGDVDVADVRVVDGVLQTRGHVRPPFGIAEVSGGGGIRRSVQQAIARLFFGLLHPRQPVVAVRHFYGCAAFDRFVIAGVVGVFGAGCEVRADIHEARGVGVARHACDRLAVEEPLVFDPARGDAIAVLDGGREG